MNGKMEVTCNVRLDVEELAQNLNDEQLRALMVGIAEVTAASRVQSPTEPPQPEAVAPTPDAT